MSANQIRSEADLSSQAKIYRTSEPCNMESTDLIEADQTVKEKEGHDYAMNNLTRTGTVEHRR